MNILYKEKFCPDELGYENLTVKHYLKYKLLLIFGKVRLRALVGRVCLASCGVIKGETWAPATVNTGFGNLGSNMVDFSKWQEVLEPVDYVRLGAVLVAFLATGLGSAEKWIKADTIGYAVAGLAWILFPAHFLSAVVSPVIIGSLINNVIYNNDRP